jgi:hypothetical protein
VLAYVAAAPLAAQASKPATIHLSGPLASFPEPFSDLSGLRELSDGRVLVSDRLEKAVRVLDFASGTIDQIGRVGSGPGEYQIPGRLLSLPGDSTLLVDFGNMRLTVIDPDGRLTRSTSMQQGSGSSGTMLMVIPSATDADGRLYFDMLGSFSAGPDGLPDSAAIARWQLGSDAVDTVAMLPRPQMQTLRTGGDGTFRFSGGMLGPFAPRPGWSTAANGAVAIVWPDDYRVEWILSDGRRRSGPPTPYEPVPVTDDDKEQWSSGAGGARMIALSTDQSSRTITLPRPDPDDMEWPAVKPPFRPRDIHASPTGALWVRRFTAVEEAETYDVFSRAGERIRQVILPDDRLLLGFGAETVYLYRTDEDDLQWIERYALPTN